MFVVIIDNLPKAGSANKEFGWNNNRISRKRLAIADEHLLYLSHQLVGHTVGVNLDGGDGRGDVLVVLERAKGHHRNVVGYRDVELPQLVYQVKRVLRTGNDRSACCRGQPSGAARVFAMRWLFPLPECLPIPGY